MSGFTKLHNTIVNSSIWNADDDTRIVWITMLALADQDGIVKASVGGLAHQARKGQAAVLRVLMDLSSPDPDSSRPEHEGRRIEKVDGGWKLLNHGYYRELGMHDGQREYWRKRKAQQRQSRNVPECPGQMGTTASASASEVEGECEGKKEPTPKRHPSQVTEDYLASLAADQTYDGIDVKREYEKLRRWCETRGFSPTRRRFVNWLNRCEPQTPRNGARMPVEARSPREPWQVRQDLEAAKKRREVLWAGISDDLTSKGYLTDTEKVQVWEQHADQEMVAAYRAAAARVKALASEAA